VKTVKTELHFDLALNSSAPGLEDDVFVLAGEDGASRRVRTVKDDKVPGDTMLTLVFPEVIVGKTYTLAQVHDGEEPVGRDLPAGRHKASLTGILTGCKYSLPLIGIEHRRSPSGKEVGTEIMKPLIVDQIGNDDVSASDLGIFEIDLFQIREP
jgi:hypothetical protein